MTGTLVYSLALGCLDIIGIAHAFREHGFGDALAATVVVPWGLYRGVESFWHKEPVAGSGLDRRYKRFMERARDERRSRDPAWGQPSKNSSKAVGEDADGLLRVSDDTVVMYGTAMANLYAALPVDLCARKSQGEADDERAQSAFAALDSTALEDYAQARFAGVAAEIHDLPILARDSAAADSAWRNIGIAVGPENARRLAMVLDAPDKASVEDRCWASRTIYFQISTLPVHQSASLMRTLLVQ
jgi:hypothetical protein